MAITKNKIEALDARFEQLITGLSLQVADSEFTPEKAAERRRKSAKSGADFARIYYPQIFSAEFNALQLWMDQRTQGNYTVSGSRLFGKSSFAYVAKVIRHIATGGGGIVNITLKTQTPAEERTASLSRIIQKNRLLCYDYNIEVLQDQKGYHIFKSDGGTTQLIATSVNQGLRAYLDDDFKRFQLAVADDLYNRESVKSQADNDRVVDFITSELWGQMEPNGLSLVLGNSITEACPMVRLKELNPEMHYSLPAMDPTEKESNWPEHYTAEELLYIKSKRPLDVWLGDYMDKPVERGDVFDPDWIRYINLNLVQIVASITAIDPAHGESPDSCAKGAATLGVDTKQKVYVLDMYLRNENYTALFDYLRQLRTEMPAHKAILFENDFAQWGFAEPYYRTWRVENKAVLPIVPILAKDLKTEYRGADKESRIMNLVHPHQTGQLLYSETLQGSTDFERYHTTNYIRFGKHKNAKLDGLDALATAYILIWGYLTTGGFQPLAQRTYRPDKLKSWFR